MYRVTLLNNNTEIIIHENSIQNDAPKIEGKVKRGINIINSFTFSIYPNNVGYNAMTPYLTRVRVTNTMLNKDIFVGRVLLLTPSMDSSGQFKIDVVCEGTLGYLHDSKQRYAEYHDATVRGLLQTMIDRHNATVEDWKQFKLGTVEVTDSNNSLYRFLSYDSTFDNLKDKFLDKLGGEFRVRFESDGMYLDYLNKIGEVKNTEIRLSKNLQSIELEKDPSKLISRLVPLGVKLKDTDERLTIKDVNGGVDYIIDSNVITSFGIKEETVTWDDVTVSSNLKAKGEAYLKENNKILYKYKISALDLYFIGLDIESFEEGNSYPVINDFMHIDDILRVIEIEIDINSPGESNLTLGEKFEDIKNYQIGISATAKTVKTVSETLGTTINAVKDVNTQLESTVKITEQNTNDIHLSKQNMSDVLIQIETIKRSIETTNTTLEKLIKRHNMEV